MRPEAGHNGGPPLDDDHVPEWGRNGIGSYFGWKRAHARAWREVSWEIMIRRQRRADAIGLSYDEYALDILERGRHLGPEDIERIAAIKGARASPHLVGASTGPSPSARVDDASQADRPARPRPAARRGRFSRR